MRTEPVIVVGVDDTAAGLRALRWAVTEASRRETVVRAVHVWLAMPSVEPAVAARESAQARAAAVIQNALTVVRSEWMIDVPPIESVILEGSTVGVLVAESATAELLVVGSHDVTQFDGLPWGVSTACIRQARCPVVVVPPPRHGPRTERSDRIERPPASGSASLRPPGR